MTLRSDEFKTSLFELMRKSSREFYLDIEIKAKDNWPDFDERERFVLATEIFVVYLWAVSKMLPSDKGVLHLLHEDYFRGVYKLGKTAEEKGSLANTAQSDLRHRYDAYYNAWDEDRKAGGGSVFGFEMAQFFFPTRKLVFDFYLWSEMQMGVYAFMQAVQEFRKTFVIIDP